jgi:hypothetical protein
MNDHPPDKSASPPPPSLPPRDPSQVGTSLSLIPVKLIDGRPPFPILAVYRLLGVPRSGDLINIDVEGRRPLFRVLWVSFDPFDPISQIRIYCVPTEISNGELADEAKLKERMDEFIKFQLQIYEKLDAYSKAIMLGGYAGIFAIWSFSRDILTPRATEWTAILAGTSLLIYIGWEIIGMATRAIRHHKFNLLINKSPSEFFKSLEDVRTADRTGMVREAWAWRFILLATAGSGYAAALLLLYNASAKLIGLAQWP